MPILHLCMPAAACHSFTCYLTLNMQLMPSLSPWPSCLQVRFTDHHPLHNAEAFFYAKLLGHVPFRSEYQLMQPPSATYMAECVRLGLYNEEDLRTVGPHARGSSALAMPLQLALPCCVEPFPTHT